MLLLLASLAGCSDHVSDTGVRLPEGRTAGDCSDGADNDGDGLFDCNDPGCSGSPDCVPADTDTGTNTDTDTGIDTDTDRDSGSDSNGDTATDTGGDTDTNSFVDYLTSYGATMVAITAGTFTMGSPTGEANRGADEVQHQVTLTHNFWMGQTEVAQGDYKAVMGVDPAETSGGPTFPAELISWTTAVLYLNALSQEEGLESCYEVDGSDLASFLFGDPYSCSGYRLPTEAEWEYAARANDSTLYAGSDTSNGVAWTHESAEGRSHAVGLLFANGWGLYDMSGNAFEWIGDRYGEYGSDPVVDPTGASTGWHVLRGGGWSETNDYARVAGTRYVIGQDSLRENDSGFRVVRSAL